MRKPFASFKLALIALLLCLLLPASGLAQEKKTKVLLDTDMVQMFDDGVAMTILGTSPNIDLVGVTTVTGNSWVQEGTAYAVRQMELAGINVPIAQGCILPLQRQRHELFEKERAMFGMGHDSWLGSFGRQRPKTWQSFYEKQYGQAPTRTIDKRHAVDFIIDTIRANPGEIVIAAIGPCTNLAVAILKDPDIVPLVKEIVFMGGSFFKPGNVTPAAEFNWWADPEAARIVVRSPFAKHTVFGLDVCENVLFTPALFKRLTQLLGKSPQGEMLAKTHVAATLSDPKNTFFVWDVLVAAFLIDPGIITKDTTCHVDVNDQFSLSYGQALAYPKIFPEGTHPFRIILDVNKERFWDIVNDKSHWNVAK